VKWVVLSVAFFATAAPLQRLVRESNSAAELRRGIKAYASAEYDAAARAFARADAIKPSPRAAFDTATAKLAQKDSRAALPMLDRAMTDPRLRPAAFYNRGTAALNARQYEQAVQDLTAALKLDPRNGDAKRNLELATQKREQQKREQGDTQGKQKQPSSGGAGQSSGTQKPDPSASQQGQQNGGQPSDPTEALLRSVQEQENAEQSRMRRARQEQREVGW
jgi:tetratricopeptide (TPR) repeat protein